MKKTRVYMCSKGHLHYCDDPPEMCTYQNCNSRDFGVVSNEYEMEDDDGPTEQSRNDYN